MYISRQHFKIIDLDLDFRKIKKNFKKINLLTYQLISNTKYSINKIVENNAIVLNLNLANVLTPWNLILRENRSSITPHLPNTQFWNF